MEFNEKCIDYITSCNKELKLNLFCKIKRFLIGFHFNEKTLLIFNDNKPTATPYHNVNNLTKSATTTAVEISIPCKLSNPTRLPSVTPIPPGKNDKVPKINEAIYVEIVARNDIESIPKARKIK